MAGRKNRIDTSVAAALLGDYLEEGRYGKHGESERRCVAEFVQDALDGVDDEGDPLGTAAGMAEYLAEVATDMAAEIRALKG